MDYPKFFDEVKKIELKDNLSNFLGSVENGFIEISYLEIVKIAGHSCPTVAGAYLMTIKALNELYGDLKPIRGEIKVEFKDSIEFGVIGVISNIISNITGALSNSGFKGINGKFSRNNLLEFNKKNIKGMIRFTRIDTNESVDVSYNPNIVLGNSKIQELMSKCLKNKADKDEIKEFQELWQLRVKEILIDNYNNTKLVEILKV